jgi:dinuclear metal center YbgI/SA1388 family protein
MLEEIVRHLNDLLSNEEWESADAATNGLQVENSGTVEKVAFAVDAATQTIDAVAERGADMLVVHHGFFWGGKEALVGQDYERFRRLVENDIALYASHLPLDAHDEVGNNALLLDALGAEVTDSFADFGPAEVGRLGSLPSPLSFEEFVGILAEEVDNEPITLGFGPEEVQRVAVLTGAGGGHISEAAATDADVYVTGEAKHRAHHDAREYGLNAVFAGHYHTETFGVRALREEVESEFDVETLYLDFPTEV